MTDTLQYLLDALKAHPELKWVINQQSWQTDFLRFFKSQTNYNITKENLSLSLSIYKGKKNFSFNIDDPQPQSIDTAMEKALGIIDSLPEDPDFVDIETDLRTATQKKTVNNIVAVSLDTKTRILQKVADIVQPHGFGIYGTFICNFSSERVLNSNGVDKSYSSSPIYLEVKAVHDTTQVTVLETFGGEDFGRFDQDDFCERLLKKVIHGTAEIVDMEAGTYDVVLAPRCIAEFVQYISWGMSARALDQRSSFFEGKLDTQVFPENITITDDPSDPDVISSSYSGEGHLYQRLPLIEKGVFKNFMCNCYYSHKTGLPENGNSANCLVLSGGDKSLEEMIGSIDKGLYISSLHYMNFINEKETSLTGLTRDGTFLIENGKISRVVNSLRFTERIERILSNILLLENKSYTIPFSGNYEFFDIEAVKAPHVVVRDFNITSSTKTI
ncbi:MAG: TldD/PmbA family protein [Candidatus Cloacimonadaceae bacterium]|nr:TldD/PmbA family protein [Candidatus Cloacimonadaceae bacterium]